MQVTYDLLPDAEIPAYKKQAEINRKKPGLFKEWKDDIKANGNIVRTAVYDYFEVTPNKSSYTYYYCDEEGVIKVNTRKAYSTVKLIATDKNQKYEVRKKADKDGIAEFTLSDLPPGTLTTKLEFENNYLLSLNTKIKSRFFLYDKNKKENETKQIVINAVKQGGQPQTINRIKIIDADKVSFFRNGKVPIALKISVVYYDDRGNKKTTVKTYEAWVQEDGSVSFNVVISHRGNHKFELSYLKDTYVGTLKVQ